MSSARLRRRRKENRGEEDAMGKVIVNESLSLDGVMQGPGAPDEDRSGGFEHGGWAMQYFDDSMGQLAAEGMGSTGGLILGRRTYEIFAAYWPNQPDDTLFASFLNNVPKYVASRTLKEPLAWANSTLLVGDAAEEVRKLKEGQEKDLLVLGSGELLQTLMEQDLVDEYQLWIHPVVLGKGKRLFPEGIRDARLSLTDSKTSGTGVLLTSYRVGEKD
jgi:dihydrofolate reductase